MTLIEDLKKEGKRMTRARTGLIGILEKSDLPLTAKELMDTLRVNKTTVYRELLFLKNKGLIRELQLGDDKKRYEILDKKDHHHLICLSCEGVENIFIDDNFNKQSKEISKKKFKVVNHSLEFFGYCRSCQ